MSWVQDQIYADTSIGPLELTDAEIVSAFGDTNTKGFCFSARSVEASNTAGCEQGRNVLIEKMREKSDELCRKHMRNIIGDQNAVNLIFGSGALTASGIATMLARPEAKTISSAIATVLGGERALINEEVYKNQIGPAVIMTIVGDRAKLSDELDKLQPKTIREENVLAAMGKARKYHNACSFETAMSKLVARGTKDAVNAIQ